MMAPKVVYCRMIAIRAVMIVAHSKVFVMCLFILYFMLLNWVQGLKGQFWLCFRRRKRHPSSAACSDDEENG